MSRLPGGCRSSPSGHRAAVGGQGLRLTEPQRIITTRQEASLVTFSLLSQETSFRKGQETPHPPLTARGSPSNPDWQGGMGGKELVRLLSPSSHPAILRLHMPPGRFSAVPEPGAKADLEKQASDYGRTQSGPPQCTSGWDTGFHSDIWAPSSTHGPGSSVGLCSWVSI